MKNAIPGELWNQVEVPTCGQEPVLISTYLGAIAYRLPSITDVMMTKEFWNSVCDFSERCGALRERVEGVITSNSLDLVVSAPLFGKFQRFVGAGVSGNPVGFEQFNTKITPAGNAVTFDMSCCAQMDPETYAVYADISVVPDINAVPDNQKVPAWFLGKYDKAILAGTFMRIYSMTGEAWSDESAARMNATTYLHEIRRVTHGLITSGMRSHVLVGAESIIARQSTTTSSQSTQNTVG